MRKLQEVHDEDLQFSEDDYFDSSAYRDEVADETNEDGDEIHSSATPFPKADERIKSPNPDFMRIKTAAQIRDEAPEEPPWIAKPWCAEGAITEVVGKAKAAGKTTWVLAMMKAILTGEDFMGEATNQTPILYLTEEQTATLREGLGRAKLLDHEDFHLLQWSNTMGVKWKDVGAFALKSAKELGCKLIVIDTISQFSSLADDKENFAGSALGALKPVQNISAAGVGVIVVRHERKGGGSIGESGRGSSAWTGAVDIVLAVQRPGGQTRKTVREIHGIGRFNDVPEKLIIERTDDGYVVRDSTALAAAEAESAILFSAPEGEDNAVGMQKLCELANVGRTTGFEAINRLVEQNKLMCIGQGKRGNPFRVFKPVKVGLHVVE